MWRITFSILFFNLVTYYFEHHSVVIILMVLQFLITRVLLARIVVIVFYVLFSPLDCSLRKRDNQRRLLGSGQPTVADKC